MKITNLSLDVIIEDSFKRIRELRRLKGGEYADPRADDPLANFRRSGANLKLPIEIIWQVYADKHWGAISQYIRDVQDNIERERLEGIEGRVDDLLTYLLLFKAMVVERSENNKERIPFGELVERLSPSNSPLFLHTQED